MKKLLYAKGEIGYSTPVKLSFLVTAERNSIMIDLVVVILVVLSFVFFADEFLDGKEETVTS